MSNITEKHLNYKVFAQKLIRQSLVWDNHACPPMAKDDLVAFLPTLSRFRQAGVTVISLNIGYGDVSLADHFRIAHSIRSWVSARPSEYMMIETVNDIASAKASGITGVLLDIEGAAPLNGDLTLVDKFYALGVRWMLLAYNRSNWAACGVHDLNGGLSEAGRMLVRRMEQTGMVVCLSHTSSRSAEEVLDMATKPVVFSHSNPASLCEHPRNISDHLMRSCAKTGGVIGVNGLALFLGDGGATANRVADHVEHIASIAGVAHVGLGLDFVFDIPGLEKEKASMGAVFPPDSGYELPAVCTPPEAIHEVVEILLARNWSEKSVKGFLGENWLRVAQSCWRPAQAPDAFSKSG